MNKIIDKINVRHTGVRSRCIQGASPENTKTWNRMRRTLMSKIVIIPTGPKTGHTPSAATSP